MDSKCKRLLDSLLNSKKEWITARELSALTGRSVRSVKNDIAELNTIESGLVQSSVNGYQINAEKAKHLFSVSESSLPYTPKERIHLIMKKLLANTSLDLFDFCENELFVSIETAKKDLSVARKEFREYGIEINTTGFLASLDGNEQDKRKILSKLLYDEFSENILDLDAIKQAFPGYDIKYVYGAIVESCKNYGFFVNEYIVLTLVFDVMISVDRLKNNFSLSSPPLIVENGERAENDLALDIIHKIEKRFGISCNGIELDELMVIITSNLIKVDFETITMKNIGDYIEPACVDLIEPLKTGLSSYDFIDINNQKFMTRFILHINNLLLRLKNHYVRKNPLTEHIKSSCPMLFECAITLADVVNQKTGQQVDEHEAAYIAMHIGSLLNEHPSMRDKVFCALLFPAYYDCDKELIARLSRFFGTSLVIQSIIANIDELEKSPDLVISVMPVSAFSEMEIVCVSPFVTERDFAMIKYCVDKILLKKKKYRLFDQLRQISNSNLFRRNIVFSNEDTAIRYMSEMLAQNGYVDESFGDEVLKRERSYSTAYGNIAVPHSMKMNAKKTGMAVLINEEPIPWGKQMVNVVLLFCVQKETRSLFYDIFDNLIVLLLESSNAAYIINSKTYDEFVENIINCL